MAAAFPFSTPIFERKGRSGEKIFDRLSFLD